MSQNHPQDDFTARVQACLDEMARQQAQWDEVRDALATLDGVEINFQRAHADPSTAADPLICGFRS